MSELEVTCINSPNGDVKEKALRIVKERHEKCSKLSQFSQEAVRSRAFSRESFAFVNDYEKSSDANGVIRISWIEKITYAIQGESLNGGTTKGPETECQIKVEVLFNEANEKTLTKEKANERGKEQDEIKDEI